MPLKKETREGLAALVDDFQWQWDKYLEVFAHRRLDTAYAIPEGKKYCPRSYIEEELEQEVNHFAIKYEGNVLAGFHFIKNLVKKINREQNTKHLATYTVP